MPEALVNIVGVGNTLMADDGVGVAAVRAMAARADLPHEAALHDAGLAVSDVLGRLDPAVPLVVIDALRKGGAPGRIYKTHLDGLCAADGSIAGCLSLHELGVVRALRLEALSGREFRHVTIFGVEPGRIEWAQELSPPVAAAVDRLVDAVGRYVEHLCAAPAGEGET